MRRVLKYLTVTGLILLLVNLAGWWLLPLAKFRYIVVHHTASQRDNLASIRDFHKRKFNHRDAAYHLILSNGSTGIPAGHLEATNRYRWLSYSLATTSWKYNARGIHLCVVGNYEEYPLPRGLQAALGHAVGLLQRKFRIPDENVLFHRDVNATACPGKYITKGDLLDWVRGGTGELNFDVVDQQKAVVGWCGLERRSVPGLVYGAGAVVNVMSLVLPVVLFLVRRHRAIENQALSRFIHQSDNSANGKSAE